MKNKTKTLGQIYTPVKIVNQMLDLINYQGEQILSKHIIDNSCGNGAFLLVIVDRYVKEYKKKYNNLFNIEKHLETYIHGIEIDKSEYLNCLNELDNYTIWQGIPKVNWDLINADTLTIHKYDGKMDYVVGNPPYVRIHNLEDNFKKIRNYKFCKIGMSDLYIVFYEIGFNMLNKTGKLCYITPNSFYTSVAGKEFRKYIFNNKNLYSIYDLGHYQPFKATSYTTICAFDLSIKCNSVQYFKFDTNGKIHFQDNLAINDIYFNDKIILTNSKNQILLKKIQNFKAENTNVVSVKNGFATLADSIYIKNSFGFNSNTIDVIKASTGEWKKCLFPYDEDLKIINLDYFNDEIKKYLIEHEQVLKQRSLDKKTPWYAFGRSQAISDVYKNKFSINVTIKDINSIKLNFVPSGKGVYSGLYILTNLSEKELKNIILNTQFIEYVKSLGKYKNGGYFTFSSNDLKQYLLYKMENKNE